MPNVPIEDIGGGGPKVFGLPIDRDLMFSNHKGIFKKRIEKRQRKLIVKLAFLKPFLKRGEKLLLVTTCYSPLGSPGQYLTGFIFIYLKRSLLVFTNMRVFHIPTTSNYKYRFSLAEIEYDGCSTIDLRGGVLNVLYAKFNKVEFFRKVAVRERRKLRSLLGTHIKPSGLKGAVSDRNFLCPRCAGSLIRGEYRCEHCQLKFKSKIKAVFLSILVPGGGYLYARQYLIGLLCALVEIFLLIYFAFSLLDTIRGISGSILYAVVTGAIYLALKTIALIHSTELLSEFIPATTRVDERVR